MEILRLISQYVDAADLPFLLIGGHAVNAYGISRQTGDLDLLVQRAKKDQWTALLVKLHYSPGQNDDRFIKFTPAEIAAWPVDLMLVDDETFAKLIAEAQDVDLGIVSVKAVSPRHLVLLKIHALKHYQEHRYVKDYGDLLQLLRIKCQGLRSGELKELCLKYAGPDLYEKLEVDLGGK